MKKTILTLCALALGSHALAAGFSKGSDQLNAVGSAWKSQPSTSVQRQEMVSHHDMTIVYGGQDISTKTTVPVLNIA